MVQFPDAPDYTTWEDGAASQVAGMVHRTHRNVAGDLRNLARTIGLEYGVVFARLLRLVPLIISAAATAQPLKITDYRTLITPSSVQVSPDGKRIAFLKTTANFETDKNESVVMVDEIATGALHSLTKPLADLSSVRWSPDGKGIAFLRKVSDKGQIFVVSADGDKPHQITTSWSGASSSSHGVPKATRSPT